MLNLCYLRKPRFREVAQRSNGLSGLCLTEVLLRNTAVLYNSIRNGLHLCMVCGHDLGPNRPHEYYCARCQHDTPTVFSVSFSLCPSLYLFVRFSFPILLSICTILISLFAFNPHSSATCAKNTRIEVSDCTGSEKSWTERKNIPFESLTVCLLWGNGDC